MNDEDGLRLQYLSRLGIEVWQPVAPPVEPPLAGGDVALPATHPDSADAADLSSPATLIDSTGPGASLADLAVEVAGCTQCKLHQTRKNTVFGVGSLSAKCMIIGEGPGAEEDARGEPFVGRAGKLLDAMLAAIGIARESVYITNMVKCRPPKNRDPQADEVAACRSYLHAQIESIRPRLIVTVGRVAAQHLLGSNAPLGSLRGSLHHLAEGAVGGNRDIPVLATYHPAYLLRSPEQKGKVWVDLKKMRELMEEGS